MKLRKTLGNPTDKKCLVFDRDKWLENIYFHYDPLLHNYLDGQVPVGIVIDYIEDNPSIIDLYTVQELTISTIIQQLRQVYTNPLELYRDKQ